MVAQVRSASRPDAALARRERQRQAEKAHLDRQMRAKQKTRAPASAPWLSPRRAQHAIRQGATTQADAACAAEAVSGTGRSREAVPWRWSDEDADGECDCCSELGYAAVVSDILEPVVRKVVNSVHENDCHDGERPASPAGPGREHAACGEESEEQRLDSAGQPHSSGESGGVTAAASAADEQAARCHDSAGQPHACDASGGATAAASEAQLAAEDQEQRHEASGQFHYCDEGGGATAATSEVQLAAAEQAAQCAGAAGQLHSCDESDGTTAAASEAQLAAKDWEGRMQLPSSEEEQCHESAGQLQSGDESGGATAAASEVQLPAAEQAAYYHEHVAESDCCAGELGSAAEKPPSAVEATEVAAVARGAEASSCEGLDALLAADRMQRTPLEQVASDGSHARMCVTPAHSTPTPHEGGSAILRNRASAQLGFLSRQSSGVRDSPPTGLARFNESASSAVLMEVPRPAASSHSGAGPTPPMSKPLRRRSEERWPGSSPATPAATVTGIDGRSELEHARARSPEPVFPAACYLANADASSAEIVAAAMRARSYAQRHGCAVNLFGADTAGTPAAEPAAAVGSAGLAYVDDPGVPRFVQGAVMFFVTVVCLGLALIQLWRFHAGAGAAVVLVVLPCACAATVLVASKASPVSKGLCVAAGMLALLELNWRLHG